jgi:hypothetical protein
MTARARLRWTWVLPGVLVLHGAVWTIALSVTPVAHTTRQLTGEFLSTFALVVVSANLMLATRARPL